MKIAISNRERWEMAQLMIGPTIQITGQIEERRFLKSISALGLTPVLDILTDGGSVDLEHLSNRQDKKVFDLPESVIEFLVDKVVSASRSGGQSFILGPLFSELVRMKSEDTDSSNIGNWAPFIGDENWAIKEKETNVVTNIHQS